MVRQVDVLQIGQGAEHQQVRDREQPHGLRLYLSSGSRPLESQLVRADGGGKCVG